jgi:hypothetical protein
MKDLILPIGSNSETRLVVKVYNDGSVQLRFERMADWIRVDGTGAIKDWVTVHVGLLSVKETEMLGEAIIKASKLLVLA